MGTVDLIEACAELGLSKRIGRRGQCIVAKFQTAWNLTTCVATERAFVLITWNQLHA